APVGAAPQYAVQGTAGEGAEAVLQGQHAVQEDRHARGDAPEVRAQPEPVDQAHDDDGQGGATNHCDRILPRAPGERGDGSFNGRAQGRNRPRIVKYNTAAMNPEAGTVMTHAAMILTTAVRLTSSWR